MKKRVVFVNHCLTGGGSEKAMTIIANYFVSKGIDVTMILLNDEERTYYVDPRIRIIECYCPIKGNKIIWHIKRIMTIRNVIKKCRAKVVITFMWDINMNVILACLVLNKKIIASERCDPKHETRKLLKVAMKFILPLSDYTVFQTDQVQQYYPICIQKRSCVIPNAIANDLPPINREKIANKIVAIGRLMEQKNFSLLINAFKKVSNKYPTYELFIYGEGPLKCELQTQINQLELSDKVFLEGYVSNIYEEISDASIYVNSSSYEGISNAMLEAMAMGIPSICTDCPVGGAKMIIKNEINGILISVDDEEALYNALIVLIESKTMAKKLSENAALIREKLSVDEIGKKWMELYDKLY